MYLVIRTEPGKGVAIPLVPILERRLSDALERTRVVRGNPTSPNDGGSCTAWVLDTTNRAAFEIHLAEDIEGPF